MKIVYYPTSSKSNKYIKIIVDKLMDNGYEIYSLKEVLSDFNKFKQVKIIHLNWFENVRVKRDFIKKYLTLIVLILFNKKIIWTMHNRGTHLKKMRFLQNVLINILLKYSHFIVIHSKLSERIILNKNKNFKNKIIYIPHPNYIGLYGNIYKKEKLNYNKTSRLNLLFIGLVQPYKNIELLLNAVKGFGSDINLTIAGQPVNDKYESMIRDQSRSNANVILNLKFLSDKELIKCIANSDILILPYDLKSSLNSGTVILGFSYAKTVICPEIGSIEDLKDKSHVLSYKYSDENEHLERIKEKISKAIDLKLKNSHIFEIFGEKMLTEVSVNNNNDKIGNQLDSLYKGLDNDI